MERITSQKRRPIDQANTETTSSWSCFQKPNGCMKVSDPYYGKRKQSRTLKRIQRKIQLSQQTKPSQSNNTLSSGTNEKEQSSLSLEIVSGRDEMQHNATFTVNSEEGSVQDAPATTVPDASVPRKVRTDEDVDSWMTKDELLAMFYRCL